ncbi:MAG: leucine-rich repeat protein [Alphaproteobacteria bacterium]|nr:leucine-rich repeat protein [Alphaproteobacteria bacterium]
MKKLSFILTLILSFNAMAETKTYQCGENCTATLDESGVLRISGTDEMYDYDDQTRYETPWRNDRNKIKSVVVEEGITSVGDNAFFGCANIEKIELAKSVNIVRRGAFDEDQNIQSVTMYDSTIWQNQDDFNGLAASPLIKIYCYGDLEKCRQNFSKSPKMKSQISLNYKGKRIYTIDEANRVAKPTGNTIRIKYR